MSVTPPTAGADDRDAAAASGTALSPLTTGLRAGEDGFRLLFANHPEPLWIYDLQTLAFLYVNDAALTQYGYTREEFLRLHITDIRPSEDAERVRSDARQTRTALQHSGVWRHRRKDGRLLDVEITSHTLEVDGRAAVLVRARDITDRRQAEAALRANEERFRATFEQVAVGLAHVGLDGQWLRVNEKLCAILGYTREELLTRTFQDVTYPADLDTDLAQVRRLLAGEIQTYTLEKRYMRKDGALVWATLTVSLLRDQDGAPHHFISVVEDISARKRLEQRTEAALHALLAMAEAGVVGVGERERPDRRGIGERLAELTRQVLGCRCVAIVGVVPQTEELEPVAIAGCESDELPYWWRQWADRPRLRDRLADAYIARLRDDEELILDRMPAPFLLDAAPSGYTTLLVPLRAGAALTGVLSVDHGATAHVYTPEEVALARASARLVALVIERERLLQERATAQARALALHEANRRMEEFLSIAGHELRTPLTSLLGNIQLATRWLEEVQPIVPQAPRLARAATLLQRMEGQGRVLNRLVNDLLDTSRIEAGRLALRPAPADLAALVREAVQEAREHAPRRTIQLELPLVPQPITADAARIAQVLANYLANALKFSDAAQPVSVGLRVEGPMARVWVRDAGPGLSTIEHGRIWERFYRAAGTAHRDGASVGLGLGLYISRSIVERHGGQVGVESAPGAGATFWFTVPLDGPATDAEGDETRHLSQ